MIYNNNNNNFNKIYDNNINNNYNNNNIYDNKNNNYNNLNIKEEPKNNFEKFISKIESQKNYQEEKYNHKNIKKGKSKEEEESNDEIEIKEDNKDKTPITFRYRVDPNNLPFSVQLSGSFEKWQVRHPLKYDNKRKEYIGTIRIKKGRYLYKYYIDGQWVINMNEKIIRENGIENNIVIVN